MEHFQSVGSNPFGFNCVFTGLSPLAIVIDQLPMEHVTYIDLILPIENRISSWQYIKLDVVRGCHYAAMTHETNKKVDTKKISGTIAVGVQKMC